MYDEVGRVSADLVITGKEQSPAEISGEIGISHHFAYGIGDPTFNSLGKVVGVRRFNYWSYSSSALVNSKDLDEHLRALLAIFMPVARHVKDLQERNDVVIFAQWESSRLVGGSGPVISPRNCRDIGTLGVELHFDIYCLLEHAFLDDATVDLPIQEETQD